MNINNIKDLLFYLFFNFIWFFKMYIMSWTVLKEQDFNILLMFFFVLICFLILVWFKESLINKISMYFFFPINLKQLLRKFVTVA